jgi:hypothetical protein
MGKVKLSEWLWRFLASVMLFSAGWAMWIFYQLNPPPLILNAAFEAAAKARANTGQNARGVISQPVATAPAQSGEPPINADKLRFSDAIAAPAPDAKQ